MTRLILGIGNPLCGDDGAGPLAVERIGAGPPPGCRLATAHGDPAAILSHLMGADCAVLLDACRSGAPPGTLLCVDVGAGGRLPPRAGLSSHGLGVPEALALARSLGMLPRRCLVLAVEGIAFAPGDPMSPAVRAALPAFAEAACRAVA